MADKQILLSEKPLSVEKAVQLVADPAAGGTDVFIGTVRNQTKGRNVVRLEFEAYGQMAISEMENIDQAACSKWPVCQLAIHHRVGVLGVGEIAVIIAVSTAHRAAAFEACRFVIDSLKEKVPIWKKEIFEDGEQWVSATP